MQENEFPETYAPPPPPVVQEKIVTPVVSYVILVISVIVYIGQFFSEALLGTDIPALFGMKINELILEGQWWRFVTPMLLHGSPLHIGFNMYALVVIGAPLERRFGHARFLLLYLSGAFAGNVFSFLFSPSPSLGASTSIFGLLGAQMVFLYQHRTLFGSQARAALQNAIFWAGVNLLLGLNPGIDNWGHLGGLFGGLVFASLGGPALKVEGSYPLFRIIDQRELRHSLTALGVVVIVFGALAAVKMFGLWPF